MQQPTFAEATFEQYRTLLKGTAAVLNINIREVESGRRIDLFRASAPPVLRWERNKTTGTGPLNSTSRPSFRS
jgi:hypothetical protein